MLKDIQLANLDATSTVMKDTTSYGGIVLSTSNLPSTITSAIPLTQSAVSASNVNASSGTEQKSDQLVVQFFAIQDGFDCEGNSYTSGRYIIQRYFLRADSNGALTEPNSPLALACEAGRYTTGATTISNGNGTGTFGSGNGQIILHRVDHFHALLGVSNAAHSDGFRYMTASQYMALTNKTDTRINSLQIGMLVRSAAKYWF